MRRAKAGAAAQVPWTVLSVADDQRALLVMYRAGGCVVGVPRVEVKESPRSVRIAIAVGTLDTGNTCISVGLTPRLTVGLRRPVAGRRIGGPGYFTQRGGITYGTAGTGPNARVIKLVPRVLGLSVKDARTVLISQGFNPRVEGQRARAVIDQKPDPDQPEPTDGVIVLSAGDARGG